MPAPAPLPPDELDDDTDEENPVDLTADEWAEFYGNLDDFEDYLLDIRKDKGKQAVRIRKGSEAARPLKNHSSGYRLPLDTDHFARSSS